MTTARSTDGWTAAVRRRLSLGRLLPLGGAADGAWLVERAATAELRRAVAGTRAVPGVSDAVLGALRISPTDPEAGGVPAVPFPPSALPPGDLRIEAEFEAVAGVPLPVIAARLRRALSDCAVSRLGLRVTEVDLRATGLLNPAEVPPGPTENSPAAAGPDGGHAGPGVSPVGVPALAAAAVPGVAYLTEDLDGTVHIEPDRIRVELATAAGHRPLDVARAVRTAVTAAVGGAPAVAVLVTAVEVGAEVKTVSAAAPEAWPDRT
jgi:hypothetical protein